MTLRRVTPGVPLLPLIPVVAGGLVAAVVVLASLPLSAQTKSGSEVTYVGCGYCPSVAPTEPTLLPAHAKVVVNWVQPQNATASVILFRSPTDSPMAALPAGPGQPACSWLGVAGSCSFTSVGGMYYVAFYLPFSEPPGGYSVDYTFTYYVPLI